MVFSFGIDFRAMTTWERMFPWPLPTADHVAAFYQSYRPIRKMAAANQHKLNFINQRNEPHHEKEHVKISDAAKFQICWPKSCRMTDI